jgi:hypothetical protein
MATRRLPFTLPSTSSDVSLSRGKANDARAVLMLRQDEEDRSLAERTRAALKQIGATLDETVLDRVVGELRSIQAGTEAVKSRMVEIGRRLLRLTEVAGPGGYRALCRAGLIPLSEPVASKLRNVALAVEAGRIPEDRLPVAVRAAYYAVSLPDDQLARLLNSDVLRPDATQRMLEEFLDRPKEGNEETPLSPKRRQQLLRRLKRLEGEVGVLRRRLGIQIAG